MGRRQELANRVLYLQQQFLKHRRNLRKAEKFRRRLRAVRPLWLAANPVQWVKTESMTPVGDWTKLQKEMAAMARDLLAGLGIPAEMFTRKSSCTFVSTPAGSL